jgi:hypothetical protein
MCAAALLVVLASACGSSGSSASSAPAVVTGQERADRMVLADGDLPGYHVQSTGAEVLADQLPPPGAPQRALVTRLVTADWVASGHSTLVSSAKGAPAVFSDANLFKSAEALRRIWVLEGGRVSGIRQHDLAPPAGAPAGTRYSYRTDGTRASYQLSWPEGRVFGIVAVGVSPDAHLSARAQARITATLGRAAKAESVRIAGAANASSATV